MTLLKLLASFCQSDSFVIFAIATAVFTDTLLYSIVSPSLPEFLRDRIHVRPRDVQNVASVTLASYGGGLLFSSFIVGNVVDRVQSKKGPFVFGLVLLLGATLMFFLSQNVVLTIIARILQGVTAAVVWISGLTFLNERVSPERVASAMGYVTTGSSVGEMMGPAVGGFVYDRAGYLGLLTAAVSMIVIDVVLRLLLPGDSLKDPAQSQRSQDQNGASEADPLLPSVAGNHGPNKNNAKATPGSSIKSLLYNPDFICSIVVDLTVAMARSGIEATLPLFTETRFGWTPTQSGLALLTLVVPSLASPIFGWVSGRVGPYWPSAISLLLITVCYIALAFQPLEGVVGVLMLYLSIFGMGVGMFAGITASMVVIATISADAGSDVDTDGSGQDPVPVGQAWAMSTVAAAGGVMLGPLIAGPIISRYGWFTFCIAFAGIPLVGAAFSCSRAIKHRRDG